MLLLLHWRWGLLALRRRQRGELTARGRRRRSSLHGLHAHTGRLELGRKLLHILAEALVLLIGLGEFPLESRRILALLLQLRLAGRQSTTELVHHDILLVDFCLEHPVLSEHSLKVLNKSCLFGDPRLMRGGGLRLDAQLRDVSKLFLDAAAQRVEFALQIGNCALVRGDLLSVRLAVVGDLLAEVYDGRVARSHSVFRVLKLRKGPAKVIAQLRVFVCDGALLLKLLEERVDVGFTATSELLVSLALLNLCFEILDIRMLLGHTLLESGDGAAQLFDQRILVRLLLRKRVRNGELCTECLDLLLLLEVCGLQAGVRCLCRCRVISAGKMPFR